MGRSFQTTRRIEFGDTDMAGIVHFSNFFRFMESAETEFLRSLGFSVTWMEGDERFGFPRVSAACDYLKPARFGDLLAVTVTVEEVGRKSVRIRHEFRRGSDEIAVGRITTVFCRSTPDHRIESMPIPERIRNLLTAE